MDLTSVSSATTTQLDWTLLPELDASAVRRFEVYRVALAESEVSPTTDPTALEHVVTLEADTRSYTDVRGVIEGGLWYRVVALSAQGDVVAFAEGLTAVEVIVS